MPREVEFKNRHARLTCELKPKDAQLLQAVIKEGVSQISTGRIEFLSDDDTVDVSVLLGTAMKVELVDFDDGKPVRVFSLYCISVERLGKLMGLTHFVAEVRSSDWFLTKGTDCRIFQESKTSDILGEVFDGVGWPVQRLFNLQDETQRAYCVQYNETHYDFMSRLLAQEGIFYRTEYPDGLEKIVFKSASAAYDSGEAQEFFNAEGAVGPEERIDTITDWMSSNIQKVELRDFDYENVETEKIYRQQTVSKNVMKRLEYYAYPARTVIQGDGMRYSEADMMREEGNALRARGRGTTRSLEIGKTFTLENHPTDAMNRDYLVLELEHRISAGLDDGREDTAATAKVRSTLRKLDPATLVDGDATGYEVLFTAMPDIHGVNFHPPVTVPWPRLPGIQTAMVVGPAGEDIYVDELGRIKVQFHWDRLGEKNETTTCWVRCAMPWTGSGWGVAAWPRIGHEVVIQFENGDPDRPMCTGMVYNSVDSVPYTLPENKTQTAIKTDSLLEDKSAFHELVFEDKALEEFVRFQSERDYNQIIKNNATITIGLEHQDPGDLTQTIYGTKTETVNTGDDILTVDEGNQTITVSAGNQDITVTEGNQTTTIGGSRTVEIGGSDGENVGGDQNIEIGGEQTLAVGADRTIEVSGAHAETIGGDQTIDVSGSISITAGTEIALTVGGSSIIIDNSGVTISGPTVSMEGSATANVGSPATTVAGDGMLTLEGGMVMIN